MPDLKRKIKECEVETVPCVLGEANVIPVSVNVSEK